MVHQVMVDINKHTKRTTMLGTCSNCGQSIKEIITIDGKSYGTTCASRILGQEEFRTLPRNFKGDYNAWKIDRDIRHQKAVQDFADQNELMRQNYPILLRLNKAYFKAKRNYNEWEKNFIDSITTQIGGYLHSDIPRYDNWDDAYKNGTGVIMLHHPISFDSLSEKQMRIFLKIENN